MKFLLCVLAISVGVAYADIPANLATQTIDGGTDLSPIPGSV